MCKKTPSKIKKTKQIKKHKQQYLWVYTNY